MSIFSERGRSNSAMLAEELEKLIHKINEKDDHSSRKELRDIILPAYEKAVKESDGAYDSDTYHKIMREISKDDWSY